MIQAKVIQSWRRLLFRYGWIVLPFVLCTGLLDAWNGGRRPARPLGFQKTILSAENESITLTVWSAERILKFPFFDGSSAYVHYGESKLLIHDGSFGYAVGGILVSPDQTQVIVERNFEGGLTSGLLIDLRTRKAREWSLFSNNPVVTGWTRHRWHTRFETLDRGQLHEQLRSGVLEDTKTAVAELRVRGFQEMDWPNFARVFADAQLPLDCRRQVRWSLVHDRPTQVLPEIVTSTCGLVGGLSGQGPLLAASTLFPSRTEVHSLETIALVATVLDDQNPDAQLSAAWALGEIAPDAPAKVDFSWHHGGRSLFWAKHREYVPLFQAWWKDRQERK
jgi:hypothetical protein